MEKTFFDYISSTDSEKVHSQTIGWLFSKNCKAISDQEKSNILRDLTNNKEFQFNIEYTLVEVNDIDIVIVCEDAVIVIENKIKASESKTQLPKYFKIIEEEDGELNHLKFNRKTFYIFLSLLDEIASDGNYDSLNYETLHYIIINNWKNKVLNQDKDRYILEDYLMTINQLVSSIKWMNEDVYLRKWVFENTDFKKNKHLNKMNSNTEEVNYVIANGLVRQMQKYYFKMVKDHLNLDNDLFNVYYGSSANNGEGLIQVDFLKYHYNYGGIKFQIGYQIQGSVIKINTSSIEYNKSTQNQLNPEIKFQIEELKKSLKFNRRNPPQTKAYYSISKCLSKDIYEYSPIELAEYIRKEVLEIEPHIEKFWNKIKQY